MCDPVSIGVGVVTAGLGSLQSIAGYQQQQAQYAYQQQAEQYQYQVAQANATAQYNQEMAAYHASQEAYNSQIEANAAAANRAYQYEQLQLKGEYDKARQQAQQLMVAKLKAQGTALASGRTGKSVALLASDAEREYGRDLAALGTNLGYVRDAYSLQTEQIEIEAKSANAQAAARRMIEPIKGFVAQPYSGPAPSAAGMVLGIGQSILSGVTTGISLASPSAGTTGGFGIDKTGLQGPTNPLAGGPITPGGVGGSAKGFTGSLSGAKAGNPLKGIGSIKKKYY
jgi:hypothetical protein